LDIWPSFSPDGGKIAFTSNRTGNYNIFVMDENGGNLAQITNNRGVNNFAAWNPSGEEIAYISNKNGAYEIYIHSLRK
jgi:Tol biopolymer transport system component